MSAGRLQNQAGGGAVGDEPAVLVEDVALGCCGAAAGVDERACGGESLAVGPHGADVVHLDFEGGVPDARGQRRVDRAAHDGVEEGGGDPAVDGAERVGEVGAGFQGHDDAAMVDLVEAHAEQAADVGNVGRALGLPTQEFQAVMAAKSAVVTVVLLCGAMSVGVFVRSAGFDAGGTRLCRGLRRDGRGRLWLGAMSVFRPVAQGVDQQIVDLGGDRLHGAGALRGSAHDHRAFLHGEDEGGEAAAAVLGQMVTPEQCP
jgi:hypothetical protein